jgi:hypothetical protein
MWLIGASFLLGYAETQSAMRNDIAVGALILIGALFWGWTELRGKVWSGTMQSQRRS